MSYVGNEQDRGGVWRKSEVIKARYRETGYMYVQSLKQLVI